MDGGRAWLDACANFKDKVKPWEPIMMPSKSMPPRCAINPFTRSHVEALTLASQPDAAMMIGAEKARSDLLALRQYTPVGMICKILEMETPSAWSDPFRPEVLSLDADDSEYAPVHSTGGSATLLLDKAELRRRPASAGPGVRPGPVAGHGVAMSRPMSAQGKKGTSADRHAPIYKDAVSFARLRTSLDKCPESARLFKMLHRVEAKGQLTRTKAVFRPLSAPPSHAFRKSIFGVSPYAESPAAQLHTLEMPPKQLLRRPSSANSSGRPSSSLGHSVHSSSLQSRATRRVYGTNAPGSSMHMNYIPPRPASAAARMSSSHAMATSATFSIGHAERGFRIRPASPALGAPSVFGSSSRADESKITIGGQRRQRIAADFIRLLCAEAGKCIAEVGEGWEAATMIWRRHPSAYVRIPHYLKQKGDLMTLGDMLTDPHFITRGLLCNGAEAMLSTMNAAVAAMTLALQEEQQRQEDVGAGSQLVSSLRRLSRVKHFRAFIRQHAVALDREPFTFFMLAFKSDNEAVRERSGSKGHLEGMTNYVCYQAQRSLQEAAESIHMIDSMYMAASAESDETELNSEAIEAEQQRSPGFTPKTSLRHAMVLREYLDMLLAHGCLECLSPLASQQAHDQMEAFSRFIAQSASKVEIMTPQSEENSALADMVHAELLDLRARESPSLSESMSLVPSSSSTRQLYLDICVSPEVLSTEASVAELKRVIRHDAASVLGVSADDLEVDRVASASARLICSPNVANVASPLGMDPSYNGPIVCFNSRPSAWEFVTIFLSAVPSTSTTLRRQMSNTVLPALRDMMRDRCVDLTIVDLDDGPSHANRRRRRQSVDVHGSDTADSILVVFSGPHQDAKVSKIGNIVMVEQPAGMEGASCFANICMEVCRILWSDLSSRYQVPSASKMVQFSSADAYAQQSEMHKMAHSFVEWPSRAEVMERMMSFVSARLTEPALASLAGAHGSGKSYMLAALAHRVTVTKLHVQTIYYRHGCPQAYCPDAFASHLCFALAGVKEISPSADRLASSLVVAARQRSILIVADGIDDVDQAMIRACISRPAISQLGGRVRFLCCKRAPTFERDVPARKEKPAFRLQPLTSEESEGHLTTLCEAFKLPLTEPMKQTIVAKKHAVLPLYLRIASSNIALFCEFRTFQQETRAKKADILKRLCQQLPGDLEYMMEDQVITLLECLYGQQLVRRVFEYLYFEESGLSVPDLTSMLAFHTASTEHVPVSDIASLCHDLIRFISSQFEPPPSGLVCIDLRCARRAIARRYFHELRLDEDEQRAVVSRCLLAQKCSDEVEAALQEEESVDDSGRSQLSDDCPMSELGGSEDETTFQRDALSLSTPTTAPSPLLRHETQPITESSSSPLARSRSQVLPSGGSTPSSGRRRRSMAPGMSKIFQVIPLEERKYSEALKEPVSRIQGCHEGGVLCMTVSNNSSGNNYVCTGGAENDIKIWDFMCPVTSDEIKVKQLRKERDANLQDLKELFSSGEPGLKLHMRNYCLEPHVQCKLSGHRGSVFSLAADNGMLVSGSADQTIRLWCMDTFKCTGTLVGHRSVVSALRFSFPKLYSAGHDGKIRVWDVEKRSCSASIDSTKRAAIHAINIESDRLFVGLERRWDETMNSVKVWSTDLSACLDELPSREMQQLVSESKQSERAVADLDKRIVQLGLQSRKLTRSPVRIAELSNAVETASENKERGLLQLSGLKEQIVQLKGDIYPEDDIYCMHIANCERTTREKTDIIFVGGNAKPILAWDIKKMMCIEAMDGEHHHADYTRCFESANGYLYSGGGKLTYQERMAASSVAAKLKLEAEHTKLKKESPTSDALNDDQCGRVTVWCTSRLIALGSIAFDCVVMSLTIVGDQLFVGDVGGNISILTHHASREGFNAEIQARVEQSVRVESSIASCFLARRQKLQTCKSGSAICQTLLESMDDPALVTALLIELGKALSQGGGIGTDEAQQTGLDCIFGAIERYRHLARLQVHALNVLSLSLNESDSAKSYILAHRKLRSVSDMLRENMKDCAILQRAGCIFYLEILKPLEAVPLPHEIVDPTILDSRKGLVAFHEHGRGLDVSAAASPLSPTHRLISEPLPGPRSPVCSTVGDEELQANRWLPGDEGIIPRASSHTTELDLKTKFDRKNMSRSKALLREIQLENVNTVIESGGLLALLASVKGYARAGCVVDSKGQADTSVLEAALPLLRFMAVEQAAVCHDILAHVGTGALDQLEDSLIDERTKLEKANLLRDNNPLHALLADLNVAQGSMRIKIRGRPVPKPVVRHEAASALLGQLMGGGHSAEEAGSTQARRPTHEAWSVILKASNRL